MTCPACNRPVATAAQVAAVETGDEWMNAAACYLAALDLDPFCDGVDAAKARQAYENAAFFREVAQEKDDADLLADARCLPRAWLAEVAAILRDGAKRLGVEPHETGGGQTARDHLQHAYDHLHRTLWDRAEAVDPDSGKRQLAHVGARCALAAELVMAGEETGR